MEEKLITFLIEKYGHDNNVLLDVIKYNKLHLLTLDLIKPINSLYYYSSKLLKMQQNKRNAIFLIEIKKFIFECCKSDLRPVFLKGLFLAADIYSDIDKRLSSDIDILICPEDILKYKNVLNNLEFHMETYSDINIEDGSILIEELSCMHIVFYKTVQDISVIFELHGSVINPAIIFKNISKDFYDNSKKINIFDLNPYVLSVEYNIVFLMLHFFKHLPVMYFHNMIFNKKVSLEVINLNDIALLIDKYGDDIDWNKIFYISKKMQVIKYIDMVSKYVNEIYNNIINENFICLLEENMDESYMVSGNYERYGLGKFMWLFNKIIDKIRDLSITDLISGKLPETIDLVEIAYMNNEQNLYYIKNEDMYIERKCQFSLENKSNESSLADFSLQVNFNKEFLKIEMIIQNKECCAYTGNGEYYDKDSIEIIIIKKEYIIHKMFTITNIENNYFITISSYNTDDIKVIDKNSEVYELLINDKTIDFILNLKWEMIGIDTRVDDIISFNIAGLVSNPNTNNILNAFSVLRSDKFIWEFDNIGAIKF